MNFQDEAGASALMLAVNQNQKGVCEALLAAGADPNSVGQVGITALMNAVIVGNKELLELLLEHGANPNLREQHEGKTALDLAKVFEEKELVANPNLREQHE